MSDTKNYQANWNVRHNKKVFAPGTENSTLALSLKDAKPLLACGAISELTDSEVKQPVTDALTEQQLEQVVTAIGALDLTVAENVKQDGAPQADVLTKAVGFEVSATLRDNAWAVFNQQQGEQA